MATKGVLAVKLSALGGIVCVEGRAGEHIITAKADGAIKAGATVGIISTTGATEGDIDGVVVAGFEEPIGILLPRYDVDCDTAVGDGLLVEIVIPKAGRLYNVAITDPAADKTAGAPFVYGAGDGELVLGTLTVVEELAVCRAFRPIEDTSRYATMIWGPN